MDNHVLSVALYLADHLLTDKEHIDMLAKCIVKSFLPIGPKVNKSDVMDVLKKYMPMPMPMLKIDDDDFDLMWLAKYINEVLDDNLQRIRTAPNPSVISASYTVVCFSRDNIYNKRLEIHPATSLMKATELIAHFIIDDSVDGYTVDLVDLHDCLASCLTVYPSINIGVYRLTDSQSTVCRLIHGTSPQHVQEVQVQVQVQVQHQQRSDFKRDSVNIMPFCRTDYPRAR